MAWFFLAIALVGLPGVLLSGPFLLIGRRYPRVRRRGATLFRKSVRFLLRTQTWLAADVALQRPGPGTLLVSNHRSTLDVFLLLAHVDGIRVLSKKHLRRVPFLNAAMRLTRQIFVDARDPQDFLKAMRTIEEGLARGDVVHVFPEYTRAEPGALGTRKFAAAPFQAALRANARIVPLVISGTDRAWPKGRYAIAKGAPVRLRTLAPLDTARHGTARALAQAARDAINGALAESAR